MQPMEERVYFGSQLQRNSLLWHGKQSKNIMVEKAWWQKQKAGLSHFYPYTENKKEGQVINTQKPPPVTYLLHLLKILYSSQAVLLTAEKVFKHLRLSGNFQPNPHRSLWMCFLECLLQSPEKTVWNIYVYLALWYHSKMLAQLRMFKGKLRSQCWLENVNVI